MPIFVNLDQRSSEWFDWRRKGITATESPMIAGLSPYCSAWHLWGEKCGKLKPHEVSQFAVRSGVMNESKVLDLWCEKHKTAALPACCEWPKDRKYRASCDGLTADNRPVEIKCFGTEHLKEIRALGLKAPCIAHCIMQVHHQIMVLDAQVGYLVFYDPASEEQIFEFEIKRDEEVIKGIISRGDEFWQYVQSGKEPPYPRDVYVPRGEDREKWALAAREYKEHEAMILQYSAAIARHEAAIAELQKKFKAMLPEDQSHAEFGGMIVNRITGRGRIDYKQAYMALPESLRMNEAELEAFRTAPTVKWKIQTTDQTLPEDVIDPELIDPLYLEPRKSYWF